MPSSWRQQALIEAPVADVWALVGDPNRFPEWAAHVVAITGLAAVEGGETFTQTSKTMLGEHDTTFKIEELDELHAIKLRCVDSGFYSRWVLTEAQEATFIDIEVGIEPTALRYRAMMAAQGGKRYFRKLADDSLDGVRALTQGSDPKGSDQRSR